MQKETLVPGSISEEELIRLVDTYSGILLGLCRLTLGDTAMAQDTVPPPEENSRYVFGARSHFTSPT